MVATKMGRRVDQVPENYTLQNFRAWTDRSRRNLGMDRLDLVQLHCPPTAVYSQDQTYDALDALVADGVIANYGVSVETCDEALTAMSRRGTATVQIILNAFRRKPLEAVLPSAITNGVGIIARVPLASGLLSGAYTTSTTFAENDHRNFNRADKHSTWARPSPVWTTRPAYGRRRSSLILWPSCRSRLRRRRPRWPGWRSSRA